MSLIRWRRKQDLPSLVESMHDMLDSMWRTDTPTAPALWPQMETTFFPPIDMYETDTEVVVRAQLSGVKREDIKLSADKNAITVRGEAKRDEEVDETGYYRREIRYGNFSRTIPMPTDINPEAVTAKFEDGILTIHAAKTEEVPTGREVEVE